MFKDKHLPLDKSYQIAYGLCAVCNDRVYIFVKHENNIIKDVCWQSEGSHLLDQSTEILLNQIRGKSFQETLELIEDFKKQLFTGTLNDVYTVFIPFYQYPKRLKSIMLPFEVLEKALRNLLNG